MLYARFPGFPFTPFFMQIESMIAGGNKGIVPTGDALAEAALVLRLRPTHFRNSSNTGIHHVFRVLRGGNHFVPEVSLNAQQMILLAGRDFGQRIVRMNHIQRQVTTKAFRFRKRAVLYLVQIAVVAGGHHYVVILPDGFLFGTDNAKVNIKRKLLSEFNLHTVVRMPGSVFSPYTSITTNILFFDRTGPTRETWFYRLDMPEGYKHFSKTKPMKPEHFAPVAAWWNDRRELSEDGFDKAKKYTAAQLAEELGYNLDQCGYPHVEEEILAPMDLIQRYQEERASLNAEIDRVLAEITAKLGGVEL